MRNIREFWFVGISIKGNCQKNKMGGLRRWGDHNVGLLSSWWRIKGYCKIVFQVVRYSTLLLTSLRLLPFIHRYTSEHTPAIRADLRERRRQMKQNGRRWAGEGQKCREQAGGSRERPRRSLIPRALEKGWRRTGVTFYPVFAVLKEKRGPWVTDTGQCC